MSSLAPATRTSATLFVLALTVASAAWAEVRVVNDSKSGSQPALEVVATPRGPWTPVSAPGPSTLNPTGDLRGDGHPAHARSSSRLLAAWLSPAGSELRLAVSNGESWLAQRAVTAEGAVGTPLVRAIGEGWLVAWHDGQRNWLVPASADGRAGEPIDVGDGRPVELLVVHDAAHVVLLDASGRLSAKTVLFSILPEIPEDILARAPVDLGDAVFASTRESVRLGGADMLPVVLCETVRLSEDRVGLLWWTTERRLSAAAFDADGSVGDPILLEAPGRGRGMPTSLRQRALERLRGSSD